MSYERGMAAIRLEAPDEIPHTQYVTHPEWVEQLRNRAGKPDAAVPSAGQQRKAKPHPMRVGTERSPQ